MKKNKLFILMISIIILTLALVSCSKYTKGDTSSNEIKEEVNTETIKNENTSDPNKEETTSNPNKAPENLLLL